MLYYIFGLSKKLGRSSNNCLIMFIEPRLKILYSICHKKYNHRSFIEINTKKKLSCWFDWLCIQIIFFVFSLKNNYRAEAINNVIMIGHLVVWFLGHFVSEDKMSDFVSYFVNPKWCKTFLNLNIFWKNIFLNWIWNLISWLDQYPYEIPYKLFVLSFFTRLFVCFDE